MKEDATLQMFASVNKTLENNLSRWEGIAALREIYDEFMKNYVRIKKLSEKQIKRPATLFNAKNKLLNQLIDKIIPVANVLEVYGTGNKKGSKPIKISKNKLLKSKDATTLKRCGQLITRSRNLYNKAMKDAERKVNVNIKSNILDYGLTEGMINELEDLFNRFKAESEQVGSKMEQENKINGKIKNLVRKNNGLLKKKMDKLMILFASRDPEFFMLYQKSRGFIMAEPHKSNKPTSNPKRPTQRRTTGSKRKISKAKPSSAG